MSKEKSACLKRIVLVIGGYILVCTAVFLFRFHHGWIWILMSGIASLGMVAFLFIYCEKRENLRIRQAESAIKNTMFEKKYTLIECDEEGDLASLFQKINTLIVCLDARYDYEKQEKKFLKDLIRDISHQLKTPLATLSIHHELLQLHAGTPLLHDMAVLCEQETDRMSELVQKLLLLARFEAGGMTFVFEQVPFRTVLEEAVQRFEARASYEKKQLLFRCGSDPDILCDRFWLVEALSNLIKNALDHTQEGGMITVETRFTMQSVQIVIEDNGEGIDPRDLPHIFKRFYRSPHSGTSHGIGLGLPLAQAIIEAHHGTIQVQSSPGKGTCFTISLLLSDKIVGNPSRSGHPDPL